MRPPAPSRPASFTEPEAAYATAKRRGMDLVTLTDHNTISGALEIAHHPDVLVGVEVTAEFPEDRVPVHVLAWGVEARAPAVRLDLHPADLRHRRLATAGRDLLERLLSQDRRPVTHAALGGTR